MGDLNKNTSRFNKLLCFKFGSSSASGSGQSNSDPQPENSQQATSLTTSSRFRDTLTFRWGSSSSLGGKRRNIYNTPGQLVAASSSASQLQALTVPESVQLLVRAHSSHPDFPALQTHASGLSLCDLSPPTTAGGNLNVVPSGGHGLSSMSAVSAPIPCAPPSTSSSQIPTPTCEVQALPKIAAHAAILPQAKSTPGPGAAEPSTPSSVVWAKVSEITKKKLSDYSLPPLDFTSLTSQSAEENIAAVVKALNAVQEDDMKKRWSYTRCGKEVIVVERLGKILKSVEKYSKVVDTAIQSNPQVSALVWAGVSAIMRVRIDSLWASTQYLFNG